MAWLFSRVNFHHFCSTRLKDMSMFSLWVIIYGLILAMSFAFWLKKLILFLKKLINHSLISTDKKVSIFTVRFRWSRSTGISSMWSSSSFCKSTAKTSRLFNSYLVVNFPLGGFHIRNLSHHLFTLQCLHLIPVWKLDGLVESRDHSFHLVQPWTSENCIISWVSVHNHHCWIYGSLSDKNQHYHPANNRARLPNKVQSDFLDFTLIKFHLSQCGQKNLSTELPMSIKILLTKHLATVNFMIKAFSWGKCKPLASCLVNTMAGWFVKVGSALPIAATSATFRFLFLAAIVSPPLV